MRAVERENVTNYLKEFNNWVHEWNKEFSDFGLTSPTFKALMEAVEA